MSTGGPDGSCSAWTLGNNNGRKRNSTEGDEGVPVNGFDIISNSSQGPPAMQTSSIATPFAYTFQQLPSELPPQQQQQMIHTQPLQQFQRPPPFHHQQPLHYSIQRLPHSQSNRHVVPQETLELHQQVLHQQLLFHQQRQPQRVTSSGTTSSVSMEMENHRTMPRSTTSVITSPVTALLASPFDTDQSRAIVTFAQDVLQPQGIFPHATVVQQSATPATSILGSFPQQHAASQAASYSHHYPQRFHQSSQSYPASPMTPFAPMPPFDRRLSSTSMLPPSASPTPSSSSSKSSTSLQQQQQQPSSSGHPVSSESQSLAPTGFKTTSPSEKGHISGVPLSVARDHSFSTEGDHMKLTDITRDNALAKEFLKSFRLRNERSNEGEAACDFCRKRKIRCDREKPSCSTCKERGVQCKKSDALRKRGPPTKAERAKLAEAGFKYNSEERRSRRIRDREESVASSSSTPGVNSNSGSRSHSKAADVFGFTATSPSSASSLSSFTPSPLTGIRTNEGRPGGIGSAGALSAELTQTSHSSSPSLLSFDSQFLSLVSPTSLTPSASSTGSLASWVATPHQGGLDRRDENVSEQNINAYLSNLHHQQIRERIEMPETAALGALAEKDTNDAGRFG